MCRCSSIDQKQPDSLRDASPVPIVAPSGCCRYLQSSRNEIVIHQLTKPGLLAALFASMFTLAAPSANAFDLIVHSSMVLKALKAQVFKERGRYYLQRPDRCSDPYLDNPTVSFKQGRVYVGARFAGKIGA